MRLLGKMVSTFKAVPYTQFHSRPLQVNILSIWNRKIQALYYHKSLAPGVLLNLNWWMVSRNLKNGKSFLPVIWRIVTANASLSR